ncbi:serine/threonine-protein kinase [Streptomyces sp. NPDC048290]|uniref:serine/threonine-protein kinase n=1 Tax=Streptomyces sp. NPDC048290 TaxID=3155811 RepID=UPI003443DF40
MALRDSDPVEVGGYRIEDRLGSGGMGVVYLARSASGRRLAVKVVHDQYAGDDEFRLRFRREVAAARRVSGAFTAPVVDADADADRPWMATLYIPGATLAAHVRAHGPLPLPALRDLAAGLAEALRDIHRVGVVHRDLKPANVMLAEDGPRVIDFGISRAAESTAEALTQTGRVLGTPPFMSPEQFAAPQQVGAATDVFSLGAVLTFAATGKSPFDSANPYETVVQVVEGRPELDAVPEELRPFVRACLEKSPEARPTAPELVTRLHQSALLTAAPAPHPAPGPDPAATHASDTEWTGTDWSGSDTSLPRPAPTVRRPRRRLLAVVAASLALIAAAATVLVLQQSGTRPTDQATASDLPADWRPWQATVDATGGSGTAFHGCVAAGTSVVCAGDDLMAAGFGLADGGGAWQRPIDPTPVSDSSGTRGSVIGTRGDDQVFVYGADESGTPAATVAAYTVQALSADTGEVLWRTPTGRGERATAPDGEHGGAVAVPEGVIALYGDKSESYALLDAEDGTPLWQRTRPRDRTGCALSGAAEQAYLLCRTGQEGDGDLRTTVSLLDPGGGEPFWTTETDGDVTVLGDLDGWLLIAARVGTSRVISRIDTATGTVEPLPLPDPVPVGAAVHLVQDGLYLTLTSGKVLAYAAGTGEFRWETNSTVERQGPPVASTTHLYLASPSGRVAALDLATGTVGATSPGRENTSGLAKTPRLGARPLLVGDALYVPYGARSLYTVDIGRM